MKMRLMIFIFATLALISFKGAAFAQASGPDAVDCTAPDYLDKIKAISCVAFHCPDENTVAVQETYKKECFVNENGSAVLLSGCDCLARFEARDACNIELCPEATPEEPKVEEPSSPEPNTETVVPEVPSASDKVVGGTPATAVVQGGGCTLAASGGIGDFPMLGIPFLATLFWTLMRRIKK